MYKPFLTASGVDLFELCTASAIQARTQEDNEASTKGNEVHFELLRPEAMPPLFRQWFGAREPRYESAFAWHPRTGRALYLGDRIERSYELPDPDWLAGTDDACGVSRGVLSVADLKTGFRQTSGSLGDPTLAGQLRLNAWNLWQYVADSQSPPRPGQVGYAAWAQRHPEQARGDAPIPRWRPTRIRLAWFLRPEKGDPLVEDGEIDPDALEGWAQRLALRAEQARSSAPELRPGEHCARCNCWDACPVGGMALRRLSELPDDGPATDEDAELAHYALTAANRMVERGKKALSVYVQRRAIAAKAAGAASGDVPISGGKALRVIRGTRREIDAGVALRSGLIPSGAAQVSVTQESIRRAMPGADMDAVLSGLEAAGAVTKVQTAPYVSVVRATAAEE